MTRRNRPRRRPGSPTVAERSEVRRAVARFLWTGLLVTVLIATPVAFWIRAEAENHALVNARLITQRLADYAISPLVTTQLLAGDPAAIEDLDARLQPWLERGAVLRIKVWTADGTIVYSDVHSLIGQQFMPPDPEMLDGTGGNAALEDQNELENEFESGSGELVEVYVESAAANGEPLIFEAYYDDEAVRDEQSMVLLAIAPIFLLSFAVLQLAQLVPGIQLARRIKAQEVSRRKLLQYAIEASDLERRRIARDLHDEVIQDLAGLSYVMEAEEDHGAVEQRPLFARVRSILQENVRTLRAMTSELYPPDVDKLGLPEALSRLAAAMKDHGITVALQIPESCDIDRDQAVMLYRVAREVLMNTVKHAQANTVHLSLLRQDDSTVMTIRDDGRGFNPEASSGEGHFGLRLMRDTIREAGGSLEVVSGGTGGTSVTATLTRVPSAA
ncbi:sensor histidine kinase [Arthrobacter sp. AET 35A]|nr:sensor histidine kinase [Arthrobacter sp. 147(2020)]MBE0009117.1 sensor histidine kinase [Arthrobacter sp. AET 35A]